jgi:aminoglycoside phosphotransferase family enzyme
LKTNEYFSQKKIIAGLRTENAYPHKVSKIFVEETHISWIFLTGLYAYKVKKSLKFGKVLDFSSLELSAVICIKGL